MTDVDVVIVGAGVVGAALARELGRCDLRVLLLDASDDVGNGTSKANTAILHTGFDAVPGTLESAMVARGHTLLSEYASAAGIPVEPTGSLLVAWDDEQLAALDGLADKARRNGYTRTQPVTVAELYRREPHLGPGALGALEIPDEGIICPWTTPLAFATEAVRLGVALRLGVRVVDAVPGPATTLVRCADGTTLTTRWLLNAAGLRSDDLDRAFGHDRFTVTPRRGQLLVFDKLARRLVSSILLPVPTAMGKGVLVAPTVFGNVMLGPTAEDLRDKDDTDSTPDGIAGLLEKGRRLVPELLEEEVTAIYAGLRAATEHVDYQVHVDASQRYLCVGGVRSTGLTAALALAEHVRALLVEAGLDLHEVRDPAPPQMPNLGEIAPRPYQRADLVAADPRYGRIVCHCERVTDGEILDALAAEVPARTWEGLRRRTRAMNGRCQGFFCGAAIAAGYRLADEAGPGGAA